MMRSIKISGIAAFFIIAVIALMSFKTRLLNKVNSENKPFAVVELFTSEGCSSCPPADELVAKIQRESKDKPVYILAYHVDYWNSLGWKDVFSNADYSKRQRDYAAYLHLQSVYTPQIVVNGKTEFVGSEEGSLRNAIKAGLQKTSPVQLSVTIAAIHQNQASLKYSVEGTDKNTVLLVALLQKNAQTKVERGENGGHTLAHVQVVRKLQNISLSGNNGYSIVALPHGFDSQNWDIVAFLQNTANGTIIAAARPALSTQVNANIAH